jgi:amidohydrolase
MPTISPEVLALVEDMTALRRDLHRHPELGFREERTTRLVAERLRTLGYAVRTGLGKTGVIGLLSGGRPGKTVLLRADIDALPIAEEADVPWRSESPGVMHACGHDAHTAMGLAAAAVLAREAPALTGKVCFVFQPAEELLTGAAAMLADGALDGVRADAAFAVHVMNRWPVGTVAIRDGAVMTSADKLYLTVTGKGGHGANPHMAIDPIVATAQVIGALQTLVSREVPPLKTAVLSLTTIQAGTAFNIIPDRVELTGTLRCYDADLREKLLASLRRTAEGAAAALRCTADVRNDFLTPAVLNDPDATRLASEVAAGIVGRDRVVTPDPLTGSDDVAYFWQRVPGCYAFVGSGNPAWSPTPVSHNPKFTIDESCLPIGAELLVRAARAALTSA